MMIENKKHIIDSDYLSSLKEMLLSNDKSNRELAVDIINASDFSDKQTIDNICKLLSNTEIPIMFMIEENDIQYWNSLAELKKTKIKFCLL